jgi:hypothetical protein
VPNRKFNSALLLPPVLAAAAVSAPLELVNELVRIPAGESRSVQVILKQRPAMVSVEYDVVGGGPEVRLALLRRGDLERPRNGLPESVLAATAPATTASLAYAAPLRGVFAVVLDNPTGSQAAAVHLHVFLNFARANQGPQITRLSPERQFTVIALSFLVFIAIVTYSARRLLRSIRR